MTYGPKLPTLPELKRVLRSVGVTITYSANSGEYRVNLLNFRENSAYYTDYKLDALHTGLAMSRAPREFSNPERVKMSALLAEYVELMERDAEYKHESDYSNKYGCGNCGDKGPVYQMRAWIESRMSAPHS